MPKPKKSGPHTDTVSRVRRPTLALAFSTRFIICTPPGGKSGTRERHATHSRGVHAGTLTACHTLLDVLPSTACSGSSKAVTCKGTRCMESNTARSGQRRTRP